MLSTFFSRRTISFRVCTMKQMNTMCIFYKESKKLRRTCNMLQPLYHFPLLLLLFVSEDMLSSGCIYQRSYKLLPPGNKRLIWLIFYNDSSRSVSTTRHKCDTTKLRPLSQTNKLGNFKPMSVFFSLFSSLSHCNLLLY